MTWQEIVGNIRSGRGRQHKAIHLVAKCCPCAILWIACWHKLYPYADRCLTLRKCRWQRKFLVAPAAPLTININAMRTTRAIPGTSEVSIDIDIGSLVGYAVIEGTSQKSAHIV